MATRRGGRSVRSGEEKVGCRDSRLAARCQNPAVERHQPQRLVGLAVDQIIQVVMNGVERLQHHLRTAGISRDSPCSKSSSRPSSASGKLRDAIKAHNRQCAAHLMQVGPAEPELGGIVAGGELPQRVSGTFERQVNLALDPGQWADVKPVAAFMRVRLSGRVIRRP